MLTAIWEGLLTAKVKRGSVIPLLRYLEAEHGGDVEQISPTELLEGVCRWCEERSYVAPDKVTVGVVLKLLGVEAGRGRQGRWYRVGGMGGVSGREEVAELVSDDSVTSDPPKNADNTDNTDNRNADNKNADNRNADNTNNADNGDSDQVDNADNTKAKARPAPVPAEVVITAEESERKGVCQTDAPAEPPAPTAALSITPDEQALAEEHGLIRGKNARGEDWWIAPADASQAARVLARELNFRWDDTPQRGDAAERGSETEPKTGGNKLAVRAWDGAVLRAETVGEELVLPAAEALASRPLDLELEGDLPCRVEGLNGDWLLHGTCVRNEDHLAMVLSIDRQSAAVVLLESVKLSQPLDNGGYVMRTLEQEKAGFEPDVRLVTTTEGGVTRTVTAPLEEPAAAPVATVPAVELKELPAAILRKLPADVVHHGDRPCRVVGDPHEWLWVCSRPASGNALLKRKAGRRWLVVSCLESAVQLIQPQVEAGDAEAAAKGLADAFKGEVVQSESAEGVAA